MATRRTEAALRDPAAIDEGVERKAAARANVVEILAGAVVELFLRQGRGPSADEAQPSRKASKSTVSRQIRGPQ